MQNALDAAILATVSAALRETCFLSSAEITSATSFAKDLALDSLDKWQFVLCLEERFDLEFSSDTVARFETVGDVVAYVSHRYFRDVDVVDPSDAGLPSAIGLPHAASGVTGPTLTR